MPPTTRPSHPIVKGAAALLILAGAGIGVWAGSSGGPPRPRPIAEGNEAMPTFLPAEDSVSSDPGADEGAAVFQRRCTGCHTVGGGDGKGPDLARAALRRDPAWVRAMVAAPDSMFRTDSLARWVLEVHDIESEPAAADSADLRALASFFSSFAR